MEPKTRIGRLLARTGLGMMLLALLTFTGTESAQGSGYWTYFDAYSQCRDICGAPIDDPSCWCYVMDPIIVIVDGE